VKPNRSIPSATVVPVLTYPDVRKAVSWLIDAFGFEERVQIGEDHRSSSRLATALSSLPTFAVNGCRLGRERSPTRC
jgi:hypothetical protein